MPRVFIDWLTEPGDIVYDPFSGRGTTVLEAGVSGRAGWGSDANPLAVALTKAKVQVPTEDQVLLRLAQLEGEYESPSLESVPADIGMLYSRPTLAQLNYLRSALAKRSRVDQLIRAMTLGMMHCNHSGSGATRGFSISMPNTFAMAPNYVRSYIGRHNLKAPQVDVFGMLRRRAGQLSLPDTPRSLGRAWTQDATRMPRKAMHQKAKLVFTSPPYLHVIKYGKFNWIRLWFLGQSPKQVDSRLMSSGSLSRYLEFMNRTLFGLERLLRDDGYVCLVIGDVRRGESELNLAHEVWIQVAEPSGWNLETMITDALPLPGKVSRIWGENKGRATKTDRILILSRRPGLDLPPLPALDWTQRHTWN
jgi:hypothetical protein